MATKSLLLQLTNVRELLRHSVT